MYTLKLDDKITKDLKNHEQGQEVSKENLFIEVLDDNKYSLKMVLDLEALGPIYSSEYGQSILCKFVNSDQYARVAEIEDLVEESVGSKLETKTLLKDETFFLKLQIKDGKYKAEFDVPMNADEPEKSVIKTGTPLVVYCKPGVWINFSTNKSGIFIGAQKISIDSGKKKVRVTRK